MACANPDGTLTPSGKATLEALRDPCPPEDLSRRLGRPLYQIRSGLRELEAAGLVERENGRYGLTPEGSARADG